MEIVLLIILVIVITLLIGLATRSTPRRMFAKFLMILAGIWGTFAGLGKFDRWRLVKSGRAKNRDA